MILRVLARSYDLGISLGPFPEAGTLANVLFYLAGIRSRTGCMGRHTSVLTHAVDPGVLDKHWADIYLETVAPVARVPRPASITYEYEVGVGDERDVSNLLVSLGIKDGAPLAVLQPGGNLHVNSKRWDAAKFARVADWLAAHRGTDVLIAGSEDEFEVAKSVATAMSHPAEVVAGKLSIGQMGALLRRADWFITNDTGMLHLAEAVGSRRIVSVFGPTDPRRIAPRSARNLVVSSKLSCAPCITLDAGDPNKRCWRAIKEECLRTLSAEEVLAHIQLPVTMT